MKIDLISLLNDNYSFIIYNTQTNNSCIIDPAESGPIIEYAEKHNLVITNIFNTHHHSDHIGGNDGLKKHFNCKITASVYDADRIKDVDFYVKDGDTGSFEGCKYRVIFVPGHTSAHIAFYFPRLRALFVGDTLFSAGCGRVFDGTMRQLFDSLNKIKKFPKHTKIFCAHEYTLKNLEFAEFVEPNNKDIKLYKESILNNNTQPTIPTFLDQELKINPFLRCHSIEIKNSLSLHDASEFEVFTKLREMKNVF